MAADVFVKKNLTQESTNTSVSAFKWLMQGDIVLVFYQTQERKEQDLTWEKLSIKTGL